mgnify:CR=1 FL=1
MFYNKHTPHIFSNLKKTPVRVWRHTYHSAEQAYQAAKAQFLGDQRAHQAIMAAESPERCMEIGGDLYRKDNLARARWEWSNVSKAKMHDILRAKFAKGSPAHKELMDTGVRYLAEGTENRFWGYCRQSRFESQPYNPDSPEGERIYGDNWHGITLMLIRESFRTERDAESACITPESDEPVSLSPFTTQETPKKGSSGSPRALATKPVVRDIATSPIVFKAAKAGPPSTKGKKKKPVRKIARRLQMSVRASGPSKPVKKTSRSTRRPTPRRAKSDALERLTPKRANMGRKPRRTSNEENRATVQPWDTRAFARDPTAPPPQQIPPVFFVPQPAGPPSFWACPTQVSWNGTPLNNMCAWR